MVTDLCRLHARGVGFCGLVSRGGGHCEKVCVFSVWGGEGMVEVLLVLSNGVCDVGMDVGWK